MTFFFGVLKRLFGEEVNKEYLIDFLNALLEDEQGRIVELTYQNTEQLGMNADQRNVIYESIQKVVFGRIFCVFAGFGCV